MEAPLWSVAEDSTDGRTFRAGRMSLHESITMNVEVGAVVQLEGVSWGGLDDMAFQVLGQVRTMYFTILLMCGVAAHTFTPSHPHPPG